MERNNCEHPRSHDDLLMGTSAQVFIEHADKNIGPCLKSMHATVLEKLTLSHFLASVSLSRLHGPCTGHIS